MMTGSPMRPAVLVVEDDLATRNLLRVVLNRSGFEVDLVSSGTDVITLVSNVHYSAVLFDLYMGGTSGHDLLAAILTTMPEMLPRVVVVSSAPKKELDRVRKLYPMICALRKPFELEELLAAVKSVAVEPPSRDVAAEFCRRSIINGAKTGVALVPAPEASHLNVAMSFGYNAGALEPFSSMALDAPYPICAAYRRQRPIWFASLTLASAEYPLLTSVWEENHGHALAALPLMSDGQCVGVAGWSFRDARPFAADERRPFEEIAAFLATELGASSSAARAG
jgi:CheY-like chemotaxis protein